ncbi:MAG: transcriptional regulator [Thiotrichales bacterium SG8_50]|jgi:CRP/FNR family transcriptional regulator|nr:MAG: transcriptional regulator [Thiotrichales bacterium SG8_50]
MRTPNSAKVISIASLKIACGECSLRDLCLPLDLDADDMRALEATIKSHRKLSKGEYLYKVGDPFRALFAIRTGSTKSCEIAADGSVQITGFHLPGELLGLDAISSEQHPCDVVALETTEICELPFEKLETLARELPSLQHQLLRLMSREIADEESQLLMLGRMKAEERLSVFLLSFSRRLQRLGNSSTVLHLPMSRQDLGEYLGLALETVSRLFSRFQEEKLITVQGRNVTLLDVERLKKISGNFVPSQNAGG